jgi:hypothetical protein
MVTARCWHSMPSDWLMADGFRPGAGGFLLDGRRERASGAYLAFRLGLDEGRPLEFECLPGDLDCMVEPDGPGLRVKESLPEESVALVRVLGVVPAPQLFDYDLEIGGRPFLQCPRRTQGSASCCPKRIAFVTVDGRGPRVCACEGSGVLFAARTTRMALHARWRSSRRCRGSS